MSVSVPIEDGSVVTWGNPKLGSNISTVPWCSTLLRLQQSHGCQVKRQLVDVRSICGTASSFAALRGDGSVVTWGQAGSGGESSCVQEQLHQVRQVVSAETAFAALRWDGRVVTWGRQDIGGDSSEVQGQLRDLLGMVGWLLGNQQAWDTCSDVGEMLISFCVLICCHQWANVNVFFGFEETWCRSAALDTPSQHWRKMVVWLPGARAIMVVTTPLRWMSVQSASATAGVGWRDWDVDTNQLVTPKLVKWGGTM